MASAPYVLEYEVGNVHYRQSTLYPLIIRSTADWLAPVSEVRMSSKKVQRIDPQIVTPVVAGRSAVTCSPETPPDIG
jgi:hypothetical protein